MNRTLGRIGLLAALLILSAAAAPPRERATLHPSATLVSADTGGLLFHRGIDSVLVRNQTWTAKDSAAALPDCVYSGRSQRMLARDSMRVVFRVPGGRHPTGSRYEQYVVIFRPGDSVSGPTWILPSGSQFTLLEISAPASPCGVNAGQIWVHWELERRT